MMVFQGVSAHGSSPSLKGGEVKPVPPYPGDAVRAGIEGEVEVRFGINADGSVRNAKVLGNPNPILRDAVLAILPQWRVKQLEVVRGTPIQESKMRICIEFKLPAGEQAQPTVTLVPLPAFRWRSQLIPPVYPAELLAKNKGGYARVSFLVGTDGRVYKSEVMEASDPELGNAVLAQVEPLVLAPMINDQGKAQSRIEVLRQTFSPDGTGDVPVSELTRANAMGLSDHELKIYAKAEVTQPPVVVQTIAPTYPLNLLKRGPKGEATIEWVVDEKGRIQAVRIISSTKVEFGYAAAHAVSQWRFKPGLKDGQSVSVRMGMSFEFQVAP